MDFEPQFRPVTQSKKWACRMLLAMHHSDWLYLQYRKRASAAPCHAPFPPQSSSKPSLWAVFPGNFKASLPQTVPGKDQQQVNMTEGCSLSYTLTRTHTCTLSSSPGENTSLTSLLARKSYLSCGGRCRYSLILDGCFQVLWFTTSPHPFRSSTKG